MTIVIRKEDITHPLLAHAINQIIKTRKTKFNRLKLGALAGAISGTTWAGATDPRAIILTLPIGAATLGAAAHFSTNESTENKYAQQLKHDHYNLRDLINAITNEWLPQNTSHVVLQDGEELHGEITVPEYQFKQLRQTHPIVHVNRHGDLVFNPPHESELKLLKKQKQGKLTLAYNRVDLREKSHEI